MVDEIDCLVYGEGFFAEKLSSFLVGRVAASSNAVYFSTNDVSKDQNGRDRSYVVLAGSFVGVVYKKERISS